MFVSSAASRPRKIAILALITAFLAVGQTRRLSAQMNMPGHPMETEDETPPDTLPVPQRLAGVGNVHIRISATPEAQMWFDQGLNLIHDFWDYESARAFEQSVRVDPKCAMCYWGLYKAEVFYHGTAQGYARQALAKSVSLKGRANKHERLYIEASAAYEDALKNAKSAPDFSQELRILSKLVKEYPQDTQGRIFLAASHARRWLRQQGRAACWSEGSFGDFARRYEGRARKFGGESLLHPRTGGECAP